jgi:hypothetical protein
MKLGPGPSLKDFMLKKQVMDTYRHFMKLTRHLALHDRQYSRDWIKSDYRRHANEKNPVFDSY